MTMAGFFLFCFIEVPNAMLHQTKTPVNKKVNREITRHYKKKKCSLEAWRELVEPRIGWVCLLYLTF